MSNVKIRVIESSVEFEALAATWEALQARATYTSIFETFDWQFLWWKSYGGKRLRVLVARLADEIVGILPLHIQTVRIARTPVRMLRFIGVGGDTSPDDLGPILAPECAPTVADALAAAALRLSGWDVAHLTDMNPACPFTSAFQSAARRLRFPTQYGLSERIAFTKLKATWDDWLGTLHRDRRYRIRKARKKLHADPCMRFFVWNDYTNLDTAVDRLVYLHRRRWDATDESSKSFRSEQYVGFHRAVMAALAARDRLRLYCLEASDQIIAMYYFYKFRDAVYLMQSGFDPDYASLRPGQVLLGHIIEHAIQQKHDVVDFLKGDHRYKDEIKSGTRETVFVAALNRRPGALVYAARRIVLPALKRRVASLKTAYQSAGPGKE